MPKGQHTVVAVAAAIRQAFNQPDKKAAVETWRHVADQLRPRWPKLATLRLGHGSLFEARHELRRLQETNARRGVCDGGIRHLFERCGLGTAGDRQWHHNRKHKFVHV